MDGRVVTHASPNMGGSYLFYPSSLVKAADTSANQAIENLIQHRTHPQMPRIAGMSAIDSHPRFRLIALVQRVYATVIVPITYG